MARVRGYDLAGFVDYNGKFTSNVLLSDGWRFVFNRQLDAATGTGDDRLFHVREASGLAGCSSIVELQRQNLNTISLNCRVCKALGHHKLLIGRI